ncbi:hypothetical protein GGQ22_12275 [Nocardioides sp. zg-579]|uniref:Uncharacterized protein n=1 Tax=Nocardioides marmotae TaxID=2663857 RepID=A0A6I3JCK5_9ACTN|nr:hypothetical protein [Nocardioides marmotae]MCR6032210.1 hypothetical protein [Gordonia jinghuaiqii]MTB95857.1 hypothetical protein [Nocardioides marmotae]QKE02793.1 hypothetical protein HPC71_18260 [Nocardioides marmotae]
MKRAATLAAILLLTASAPAGATLPPEMRVDVRGTAGEPLLVRMKFFPASDADASPATFRVVVRTGGRVVWDKTKTPNKHRAARFQRDLPAGTYRLVARFVPNPGSPTPLHKQVRLVTVE